MTAVIACDLRFTGRPRTGFTLVELLVVIVIIGILVGLLVPVIGMARASVQESTISTEVASISQALQSFKTQYQAGFPTDFSVPPPNLKTAAEREHWKKLEIDRFLSRLFRYRNATLDIPLGEINGIVTPLDFRNLDPSEALWFWLRGFSDDPAFPLRGPYGVLPGAVARTPILEFDESRLLDLDKDGFMEYYPRFASERPYVYLVHHKYIINRVGPSAGTAICRAGLDTSQGIPFPCPQPYLKSENGLTSAQLQTYIAQTDNYAEPQKFQILCAGLDNAFFNTAMDRNILLTSYPLGPYPDKLEHDNITNFAEGTLEDKLP